MPEQVWRTNDGNIFQSKQEALDWEARCTQVDDIAHYLYNSTAGIYEDDCREVAIALLEKYTVVPK